MNTTDVSFFSGRGHGGASMFFRFLTNQIKNNPYFSTLIHKTMSETLNQRKPQMQGHLKRNVIPYFGSCLLGFKVKEKGEKKFGETKVGGK